MKSKKKMEAAINEIPVNTLIQANELYKEFAKDTTEAAFYKSLERFCKNEVLVHLTKGIYYKPKKSRFGTVPIQEKDIVSYYISEQEGLTVGYKLYNRIGLTTQIGKQTEVYSNRLAGQRKTVQNVVVKKISCSLNKETIAVIETLEILQNYSKIEDRNNKALVAYMERFAQVYSDSAANYVLDNIKYKKATIAFLHSFLNHMRIQNTLGKHLSSLSVYANPDMEELYASS